MLFGRELFGREFGRELGHRCMQDLPRGGGNFLGFGPVACREASCGARRSHAIVTGVLGYALRNFF